MTSSKPASPFPSVDRIMRSASMVALSETYGRTAVVEAIRSVLGDRRARRDDGTGPPPDDAAIVATTAQLLEARTTPALRRVLNLTGTVLHTNLGRALLSESAIAHAAAMMRDPCNLEFDLTSGERGERDCVVEGLLTELTGAEAATVVNNNAAAVMLVLAALAHGREVLLSRGELIEIGGSFRIPDVMRCANVRLVEVGTTNRTHAKDYVDAIGPETALLMKVYTSNYRVVGFTAGVSEPELAALAHERDLPFAVDLGAGSLIDLEKYGLPKEPVVRDILEAGVDIVTFSGDKLLGGPQAGLIVGKRELVEAIARHPLKRALRVSKLTLAALEATLLAYRAPDRLTQILPTMRLLTRPLADIEAMAQRLAPRAAAALGTSWRVSVWPMASQVGSGSLPMDEIPSAGLAFAPAAKAGVGAALEGLLARLRALPVPIIARVAEDQVLLDLRCLEDENLFLAQMDALVRSEGT